MDTHMQRMTLTPYLTVYIKINSKWINELKRKS